MSAVNLIPTSAVAPLATKISKPVSSDRQTTTPDRDVQSQRDTSSVSPGKKTARVERPERSESSDLREPQGVKGQRGSDTAKQADSRAAAEDDESSKVAESSVSKDVDAHETEARSPDLTFGDMVSFELNKPDTVLVEDSASADGQVLATTVLGVSLEQLVPSGDSLPSDTAVGQILPVEDGDGLPREVLSSQTLGLRMRFNATLSGNPDAAGPRGPALVSSSTAALGLASSYTAETNLNLSDLAYEGGQEGDGLELDSLGLGDGKVNKGGSNGLLADLSTAELKQGVDFSQLLGSLAGSEAGEFAEDPVSWQSSVQTLSGMSTVSYKMVDGLPVVSSVVSTPVGAAGWTEQVANQVAWFSSKNVTEAEIQLDPPELGPLQVKVSSTHDQTTVSFTSTHANVRDALDQGLARLKEMFAEQGLNLVDVDVSGQSAHDESADEALIELDDGQADDAELSGMESSEADAVSAVSIPKTIGLVNEVV